MERDAVVYTIEEYWSNCEKYGMVREYFPGKMTFRLPPELGEGGFEIWGDRKTAMACLTDLTLHKPWVVFEHTGEKYLEFGQFYSGEVNFYKKRSEIYPVDHGLNYLVNYPPLSGYKKIEPGIRLINIGLFYREEFFNNLPYDLPADFWETAAMVLNPDLITFPQISLICEQLRNCRLTGTNLEMFVQGKALEALSLTIEYIYENRTEPSVCLTAEDRMALGRAKELIQKNIITPPSIKALSLSLGLNQRKLMAGFKQLNGITIYTYLKHLRMERAAELLQENSLAVSEIARRVGYHGDGHFQKAFRDIYGVTPSKIRKELQEK